MKSFFDPRVLKSSQGCHYPMVEPSIKSPLVLKALVWLRDPGSKRPGAAPGGSATARRVRSMFP